MADPPDQVQLDNTDDHIEVVEGAPPPPIASGGPDTAWGHRPLYDRVLKVLYALPARFRTKLSIAGVSATDLFTLNTALGAAIEVNVVEALNDLRALWDPENRYSEYSFVRHPQAFPDVRFEKSSPGGDPILFGIELKGWFLLGKEGEPSFRYKVSPNACAPADLLVVFPWTLDEVTSGTPRLLKPFIAEARHAAEHRNYYWRYGRRRTGEANREINFSEHASPYPSKADKANDVPVKDSGNFGRVARGGFMNSFVDELLEERLGGIPAKYWQEFLRVFAEGANENAIRNKLSSIRRDTEASEWASQNSDEALRFLQSLDDLIKRVT